jgi:hypothetical protein
MGADLLEHRGQFHPGSSLSTFLHKKYVYWVLGEKVSSLLFQRPPLLSFRAAWQFALQTAVLERITLALVRPGQTSEVQSISDRAKPYFTLLHQGWQFNRSRF